MSSFMVFFDLGKTLAVKSDGTPILSRTIEELNMLSENGVQVVICSGSPIDFLIGVVGQAQLHEDTILVGETGGIGQRGVYGGERFSLLPPNVDILNILDTFSQIEKSICDKFGGWRPRFLRGEVSFNIIFQDEDEKHAIKAVLEENSQLLKDNSIVAHEWGGIMFELLLETVDKGTAVKSLAARYGIATENIIAVGDGINDIPMFAQAGTSIGINRKYDGKNHHVVDNIGQAMSLITELVYKNATLF